MSHKETHNNKTLTIEVIEDDDTIHITWSGKSSDREPGIFITPILTKALNDSLVSEKSIIMNFQGMKYMNSSTLTPISKIIELGNKSAHKIQIIYNRSRKWQELSFSALRIFETKDKRIHILGK